MSQTLSKGLRVLEALASSPEPRGLTELARSIGMNQSAVQRLLNALVADGYVEQPRGSRRYRTTLQLWEIGMRSTEDTELHQRLRPVLRLGMQATGLTCFFALSACPFVIYLARVEGPRSQPHSAEPGRKIPMTLTASGQAIFPWLPEVQRQALCGPARDWTGHLTAPAADPAEIARITEEVRRNRYAASQSGIRKGRNSVAAPVWADGPLPLGAIVLTAGAADLPPEQFPAIGARVLDLAEEATISLGGTRFRNAAEQTVD